MALTSAEGTELKPNGPHWAFACRCSPSRSIRYANPWSRDLVEKQAKWWMDGWASVYANAAPGIGAVTLRRDPGREVFRGPSSRCSRPAQAAPIDPVDE